jgi:serine/threonine-protein kinase mTOR
MFVGIRRVNLFVKNRLVNNSGNYMMNSYEGTCSKIISLSTNKDKTIQKAIILIIPSLAAFNPTVFKEKYLHSCKLTF